jgi:hypothetical protein
MESSLLKFVTTLAHFENVGCIGLEMILDEAGNLLNVDDQLRKQIMTQGVRECLSDITTLMCYATEAQALVSLYRKS